MESNIPEIPDENLSKTLFPDDEPLDPLHHPKSRKKSKNDAK
jgi:hypothetical protein